MSQIRLIQDEENGIEKHHLFKTPSTSKKKKCKEDYFLSIYTRNTYFIEHFLTVCFYCMHRLQLVLIILQILQKLKNLRERTYTFLK